MYLAGDFDIEINLDAADLNSDGKVTIDDLVILQRHLAGWAGYEILPLGSGGMTAVFANTAQTNSGLVSYDPIPGGPNISVGNVTGKVGQTIAVPFIITNNPGIAAMRLFAEYDDTMLKLVGFDDTGILGNQMHKNVFASPYIFLWSNVYNNFANGEVVTLFFEVLAEGTSGITVVYDGEGMDIHNAAFESVRFGVSNGSVTGVRETTSEVTLVSAVTSAKNFISITETAKNSKVWTLKFNVVETYSDGTVKTVTYSVNLNGSNANLEGKYTFSDGALSGYTLVYDIKGNGANIKDLRLIK